VSFKNVGATIMQAARATRTHSQAGDKPRIRSWKGQTLERSRTTDLFLSYKALPCAYVPMRQRSSLTREQHRCL
jgi:hypothetical protein